MSAESERKTGEEILTTVCSSHCGGTCPLKLHIKDGVITRIENDEEFRACIKGRSYRQRVYAPDRLKYPMKRVGERGKAEFERVSWDEALDTVAAELTRVRERYGPAAVLLLYSVGDRGSLHNPGLMERVLARSGGFTGTWGNASNEGAQFAAMMGYGMHNPSHTRDDLLNSRLIVLWGHDPVSTIHRGNTNFYLARAKEAGIKIISVDPRYTDTAAAFADQWIPIRPNTDAAMLITMAYTIFTENLHDRSFLEKYTLGFDRYLEYVMGEEDGIPKTPEWAEAITGVPAATIASLAREYAARHPAVLIDGYAPGRTAYGEEFHRAAIALAAMTANIGVSGGNSPGDGAMGLRGGVNVPKAYEFMKGDNPLDLYPPRKDALWYNKYKKPVFYAGGPSSSRINRHRIADAILKGREGGYPADYRLLYIVNCNYVNQYANINKIAEALKKLEFIVVQEQFMTATAKFADILLPTNSFLERNDVTGSGISCFLGYTPKVMDSQDESRPHYEIASELAARLGIPDFSEKTEEEWLRELASRVKEIPDLDWLKEQGVHKVRYAEPFVAFRDEINDPENHPFPTVSGKIEIYSEEIADQNNPLLPPVPKYIEAWESLNDPLAQKYPLQLITLHTIRRAHTQFDNIPWLRELYPQAIWINPEDAVKRGIKEGDMTKVWNDRGSMIIPANVTERIMPGVVAIPQGAWYDPDENGVDRGGCPNVLTRDGVEPGACFPSNTALVQVQKQP